MQIFFGPFDEALQAGPTQWRMCPYRRQGDTYSFSQVLFRAIGLPEAISDGNSNITMHQILRLIYDDQLTPIQRIFRSENFDTWQTRQAVGELMCGIGGYDLYQRQIDLRALSQEFDEVSRRLKNLIAVASTYGDQILVEHIAVALRNDEAARDKLQAELATILTREDVISAADDEVQRLRKSQSRAVARARRSVAELDDRITTLEYEIDDARLFITHLERTLVEFNDAATTFFSLGQVRFEFCPSCFKPVDEAHDAEHCHLCGAEITGNTADPKRLAVRLDLEMQLTESRSLQVEREEGLARLKANLRSEQSALKAATEAFELSRRGHATEQERVVAELSRKMGYLESQIKLLQNRLTMATEIEKLSADKERLNGAISRLKTEIDAISTSQQHRKALAYTEVSSKAKEVLDQDLAEHNDFGVVTHVSFSFAEDWIAINDDKNRSRSASGMVVLKNSFLFGMYLAALEDNDFALPRFMLFDNIEDKGMVQERSWNFQRVMVRECARHDVLQQIIFSTSKIAPELDKPDFVIGRKYTHERPSLEFLEKHLPPV
jgi:hypothetical protein